MRSLLRLCPASLSWSPGSMGRPLCGPWSRWAACVRLLTWALQPYCNCLWHAREVFCYHRMLEAMIMLKLLDPRL